MALTKKISLGVFFLVLVIVGEIYVFSLHFETRAWVFRAHFVVLVEVFLCLVSRFLWRNLTNIKRVDHEPDNETRDSTGSSSSSSSSSFSNVRFKRAEDSDILRRDSGSTSRGARWSLWKTVLLVYLVLSQMAYLTNYMSMIGKEPHWFAMLAYCSLGSYIQLAVAMAILKLMNCAVYYLKWKMVGNGGRMLSKRMTAFLAVSYAVCAAFYGLTAAAGLPVVKRVSIPVKGLTSPWHMTRVVQVSDIHLGPTVGFSKLNAIVNMVNDLDPDLVVLTGDLVDGSVAMLSEAASPLARVTSTYGNFFVTGNHEYYTGDVDNWFTKLRALGFTVLHNSNLNLIPSGGTTQDQICLAGGDDVDAIHMRYTGHGFDVDGTLASCDQQQPVILLAHQPKAAKQALLSDHRVDLVLSGHTHGGQFFPLMAIAYWVNPFFLGLYRYGESAYVYVSEGTQYWGIPMRLGTTMEISLITLLSPTALHHHSP